MIDKHRTYEYMLIMLVDLVSILVSLALAYAIRFGIILGKWQQSDESDMAGVYIISYIAICLLFDFYHRFFRRGKLVELLEVIKDELITSAFVVFALYLLHSADELPRLVFGYFLAINLPIMYVFRLLLKRVMLSVYRNSKYSDRMLLVTNAAEVQKVVHNITRYQEWQRNIVGIVLLDQSELSTVEDIPVVHIGEDFMDYAVHSGVDEVFFAGKLAEDSPQLESWVDELCAMGVCVNVNISAFDIHCTGKRNLGRVGKYASVTFVRNAYSKTELFAKRMLDICGALVGMVLLAIATVFVAPAIKLDSPGPVFFGQTRMGKNGRTFKLYKFRSMYIDAEERKKELMAQNEMQGLMFKMENDPRITRVGKFIRRTSIDELPQFWNILIGDMSLVGTRPPTLDEFKQYESKHKCRLSMTPGLTGMWQISGRSDIKDFDEVVKLDMEYIDNWTIWKDIKILFKTVKVVFLGKGSE